MGPGGSSGGLHGAARRGIDNGRGSRIVGAMRAPPPIVISHFDHRRLSQLLDRVGERPELDGLRGELERAVLVEPDRVPSDLVTMNSRVRFVNEDSGDEHEITLVFPGIADMYEGRISVFAPIGSALLGLSIGESIDWPLPDGRRRRLRVLAVTYQPEAAGDPI